MNGTTNALEVLRERLQGNSRTLVVQLEPHDCAALVELVDQAIEERKRAKAELEAVHDEYRKATAPKPPVIWGVEGRFPRVDVSKAAKTVVADPPYDERPLGCQRHREHAPHCPSVDVMPREDVAAAMDAALESVNALQAQLTTAKMLLQECLDGSPGRVSSWRTRVEAFLRGEVKP